LIKFDFKGKTTVNNTNMRTLPSSSFNYIVAAGLLLGSYILPVFPLWTATWQQQIEKTIRR
jgi:hypothetical protein